jgi:hypothetical protein
MKRTAKYAPGSLCFDRRRGVWQFYWYEQGKRRSRVIGARAEFATKTAAWREVESTRLKPKQVPQGETMATLIERYQDERIPTRHSTRRVYGSFLRTHISPRWGDTLITDMQPREVELWLRGLDRSPKTRPHLRNLLHVLMEFEMWSGMLPFSGIRSSWLW